MPLQDSNESNKENTEVFDNELAPNDYKLVQRILHKLDWRLEPSKSFSDWRILITDQDDEDAAPLGEYNVHKNILALGDRGSVYFASLFETDTIEHQEKCSKISLSKARAKAFPHLLDFIYHKVIQVEAPELYIHLYLLKEYFQVTGRKLDKIISRGIFDACKDYDTLILLEKTARELMIDSANDIIFTPMKRSFVQYSMKELAKLNRHKFESKVESSGILWLQFLLESVKYLDQELSESRDGNHAKYCSRYLYILACIQFSAARIVEAGNSTQFPLTRNQMEETFGNTGSRIWQIKNLSPGSGAYLSLCVLLLEDVYCEPLVLLSESQKAAMKHFRRLASRDGMSPQILFSKCDQILEPGVTAFILSRIRADIGVQLSLPGIAFSTRPVES